MNYTENYHLPQWEESDRIMMTDFNAAMAGIEAGLTGAAEATEAEEQQRAAADSAESSLRSAHQTRALSAMGSSAYQLSRLRYMQSRERQYIDPLGHLLTDDLSSAGMAAAMSGSISYDAENNRLKLWPAGCSGTTLPAAVTTFSVSKGNTVKQYELGPWQPQGKCQVNSVGFTGACSIGNLSFSAEILLGDTVIATSVAATIGADTSGTYTTAFSPAVTLESWQTYQLRVKFTNSSSVKSASVSIDSGYTVAATAIAGENGQMVGSEAALCGSSAILWLLWSGAGTVTPEIKVNGAWQSMTAMGSKSAVNNAGESCTELLSRFDEESPWEALQVRLTLAGDAGCAVYGYGVASI